MNIIRLYNQNRKQLFIVLLIVAFIISVIHFVNYLVIKSDEKNLNSEISSSNNINVTTTYNSQKSAISSSNVSNTVYKKQREIIDNFMKYCNEGKITEAYNLLSKDCKEVMFPTLEYFKKNYVKNIFYENKLYTIKNWTGNTYKISITENILSTGKSNKGVAIEDYFTIITEGNIEKLNINGFINRTEKGNIISKENIDLQIICEDQYMNYVIYTIKVKNKTNKTICLDSGESTKNMYVEDNNNVKYMSYRNEITNAELRLLPYSENTIQIKYGSTYIYTKSLRKLVFSDIILDYDLYLNSNNITEYKNREKILIQL